MRTNVIEIEKMDIFENDRKMSAPTSANDILGQPICVIESVVGVRTRVRQPLVCQYALPVAGYRHPQNRITFQLFQK